MWQMENNTYRENNLNYMLRNGIGNRTESIIMPLYKFMVHLHLECCGQLESPHLKKDVVELEKDNKDDQG